MYDNLESQPTILATVVRGFITRYAQETEWLETLVALPPGVVACDADAVLHYRQGADGRFYEYYGWDPSSEENPIYVCASDFLEGY